TLGGGAPFAVLAQTGADLGHNPKVTEMYSSGRPAPVAAERRRRSAIPAHAGLQFAPEARDGSVDPGSFGKLVHDNIPIGIKSGGERVFEARLAADDALGFIPIAALVSRRRFTTANFELDGQPLTLTPKLSGSLLEVVIEERGVEDETQPDLF